MTLHALSTSPLGLIVAAATGAAVALLGTAMALDLAADARRNGAGMHGSQNGRQPCRRWSAGPSSTMKWK